MKKIATNVSMKQRRHSRIGAALPTHIKGVEGVTRDVSATGLYILQNSHQEMGARIEFSVDLDTPGGILKLCCEGEVVRVEEIEGRFGVGIKILKQVIKSNN